VWPSAPLASGFGLQPATTFACYVMRHARIPVPTAGLRSRLDFRRFSLVKIGSGPIQPTDPRLFQPAKVPAPTPPGAWAWIAALTLLLWAGASLAAEEPPWVSFSAQPGPGAGKHVLFISGDEEYRSEESLPMLAAILAQRHGFRCTVLFAINRQTGEIDPNTLDHIPGLEALATADLLVICTRFRELPDDQMRHLDAYLESAKPVIGIRPAVVAFRNKPASRYFKYSSDNHSADYPDGFGQQVLGSTWISHHGTHGKESTRGLPMEPLKAHPILRGVGTIWGPTDVYTIRTPIPRGGEVLIMGQVLTGMKPDDPPSPKAQMPLAWTTGYQTGQGTGRVFMTTIGASQDFADESLRRLFVNACYWAVGLQSQIPPQANVATVGSYEPTPFGFNTYRKGVFPKDLVAQFNRAARNAPASKP
jgi:type 1 glutamine amidotransferase